MPPPRALAPLPIAIGLAALLTASAAAPAPARLTTGADGAWKEVGPPIFRETIVYDSARQQLILLGGGDADNVGGVWVLPLGASPPWTFVPTPSAHPPLGYATAIYDAPLDRVIVYAINMDAWGDNVVWALSLASMTWSQLTAAGGPPPMRWGQSTLFDPVRDRMILFGGGQAGPMTTGPQFNDVWALSLSGTPTWTEIHPSGTPPMGRQYAGGLYDPVRDRMVFFAGAPDYELTNYTDLNDVWQLSLGGAPAWTQLNPSGPTPPRNYSPGTVYDPLRDRMMVAGGYGVSGSLIGQQVWALDFATTQWAQLTTTGSPRGGGPITLYDPGNDRLLSYNGAGTVTGLDIPSLVWSRLVAGAGALAYDYPWYDHQLAYDAARSQVLITGGFDDAADYWPFFDNHYVPAYSLATRLWVTPLDRNAPYPSRPASRADHSAVVDGARDRFILFGGLQDDGSGGLYSNETWSLNLTGTATWTRLAPTGTPPPGRSGQATILDVAGDRMVIFGGTDDSQVFDDVWALSLAGPQWTSISPSGTPPPARQNAAACYDSAGQRMIVFGGFDQVRTTCCRGPGPYTAFNDVWALALSGSPGWTQLLPIGTPPPPTTDPIAVYDSDRNHVEIVTDAGVWALSLGSTPAWTALDISGAVTGTLGRGSAIYDPIHHNVLAKPARTALLWELDLTQPPTAVGAPPIRVDDGLTLRGAVPNPTSGDPAVSFTLPGSGPARLDLLDLAGRGLASREVGDLGPGTHVARFGLTRRLAPGVYLVRLTRTGRSRTVRIAVVR